VYVGMLLMQIGIVVAYTSWLYLFLTVVLLVLLNTILSAEERFCIETYGEAYKTYMRETPRWIGISNSSKKTRA